MYANLFDYNSALRRLEFICADKIREDGTVSLPFTRASDYTIILSASPMGGTDAPENPPEEAEPAHFVQALLFIIYNSDLQNDFHLNLIEFMTGNKIFQ